MIVVTPGSVLAEGIEKNDGVAKGVEIQNDGVVPTCTLCEKVLIEEMRRKYGVFDKVYALGHAVMNAWLVVGLPKEEREGEEDNAVRKCRTCEKVYYRRLRARSPVFNKFYTLMDATIEGWLDKFLSDDDREAAFKRDPPHARALVKFNPRNYFMGEDFILGIKFDGCVAQEVDGAFPPERIGEPVEGVKEQLLELKGKGAKIVVYGWRSNAHTLGNPTYRKEAERWMKAKGIPYDFFYDGKGPLIGDVFISKRVRGESLRDAYGTVMDLCNDPEKAYLQTRHIL